MAGSGPRSILLVEELAHWTHGHFPVRCAQLATAYVDLGYRVELLTSEGWARDFDHPQPPFAIRRYRLLPRWFRRLVARSSRPGRNQLLTLALVAEARAAARQMVPEPAAVIVLGWNTDPSIVALTAGRGRWLVNQFRDPTSFPMLRLPGTVLDGASRLHRGRIRVVVDNEHRRAQWAGVVPALDPVVAPVAGARSVDATLNAREQLGLPADRNVALLFGEPAVKRRDVVLDAFDCLPEWTLAVGGRVAEGVGASSNRIVFPGVVSDETRDRLFAAADLVVLSFPPDHTTGSGTLLDAISFGVPVVASEDATVTRTIVREYRLGTTFEGDDPASLVDAVNAGPRIDADELARARAELSNERVALRQLELLGLGHSPRQSAATT
jgi:glycosyltransferase involved in cell wall biosynthesis